MMFQAYASFWRASSAKYSDCEQSSSSHYIRAGFDCLFKTSAHTHAFRFNRPFPRQSAKPALAVSLEDQPRMASAGTNGAEAL
jgi:hypothetical protein